MKVRAEVTINRPRQRVIDLITNPENTPRWQSGVKSIEPLSGERDQVGARSRVIFEQSGLRLEVIETVIRRDPPEFFASAFAARGVRNTVENRFYEVSPTQTRWVLDNTLHFGGLLALAEAFAGKAIAKQTVESMNRFKAFAESD